MKQTVFSDELEGWLHSKSPKTIQSLSDVFAEKSFAIAILILMFFPTLPIPTGGITHVFELIVMLLSLELMIGRRKIWLPKKWQSKHLGKTMKHKITPMIIKKIRWFERYSRPRLGSAINHNVTMRFLGALFFVFALAAFVSPPFAGLDTVPSLGAVIVALALILDDVLLMAFGTLVGALGVGLVIASGGITIGIVRHFLNF